MVSFKDGVVTRWNPTLDNIQRTACAVFEKYGLICVVTSGSDGKHMQGSKHYTDKALDLRRRHIPVEWLSAVVTDLKQALGNDYDVILEGTHIHVENDPKEGRVTK